jgi:hypothetical protein
MAVSIFGVDSEVPPEVLAEIRRLPEVLRVRAVTV